MPPTIPVAVAAVIGAIPAWKATGPRVQNRLQTLTAGGGGGNDDAGPGTAAAGAAPAIAQKAAQDAWRFARIRAPHASLGHVAFEDKQLVAAMWLPPGVLPESDRLAALTEEYVPQDRLSDMMRVFERMDTYHPPDPCWYLPLIGVDPAYQGQGYGSTLLRHALARCDRDGVAAYLESSNPRNIPLGYGRSPARAPGTFTTETVRRSHRLLKGDSEVSFALRR